MIFWLNECHTLLHTHSHERAFLSILKSQVQCNLNWVKQDPPKLFVPVFTYGGSPCLHKLFSAELHPPYNWYPKKTIDIVTDTTVWSSVSGFNLAVTALVTKWINQWNPHYSINIIIQIPSFFVGLQELTMVCLVQLRVDCCIIVAYYSVCFMPCFLTFFKNS